MNDHNPRPLESLLDDALNTVKTPQIPIGHFIDALRERGFGILVFLFALPMAIPLPVPPGVNLLFSTPLLFLTFQMMIGSTNPWLPQKIRLKQLKRSSLEDIVKKSRPWLKKFSFLIHPRLAWMTYGVRTNIIGLCGFLFALCISVPIPMTNTVPSLAVLLMAVGILMRDGLAVIGGIFIGFLWIALLATIGISGFIALINTLF
jgi:hypothetical protein